MIALINRLTEAPGEWALVLDGYQHIHARAIHEAVALLVDYPPSRFHLYLTCWDEPPLPLARWRVRRQLVEIAIRG